MNYRNDEDFSDFIEYNDLGMPLAYAIANDIVKSTDTAQRFIEETFDLFITGLGIEDTGFDSIDQLLDLAESNAPNIDNLKE